MKTPQKPYPELAQKLGLPELWFKREDLHPYGSHKGRSIPLMIKEYAKIGITQFVISSSGNAALAAIIAVQKHNQNNKSNVSLTVFVGKNIDPKKFEHLKREIVDQNIQIKQTENPKQDAFQAEKNSSSADNTSTGSQVKNLRQSTDELALRGYIELGEDLAKIPNLQAIFIPTSSGTAAQALGEAFLKMKTNIQIHVVQTTACHPIAEMFDKERAQLEAESIAGAIVDKIAHRKTKVIEAITNTHGSAWIATNEEIREAVSLIKENTDFVVSYNSALALAGLLRAQKNNWTWNGPVCCLITGR
jgi:threonine synthase